MVTDAGARSTGVNGPPDTPAQLRPAQCGEPSGVRDVGKPRAGERLQDRPRRRGGLRDGDRRPDARAARCAPGVDIEDSSPRLFGNVWALLATASSGGPAAGRAVPVPVHSATSASTCSPRGISRRTGDRPALRHPDEQPGDLARVSVTALRRGAVGPRARPAAVPQKEIDKAATIVERFMKRWRGEPDPRHVKAVDGTSLRRRARHERVHVTARIVASTGADAPRASRRRRRALRPLHAARRRACCT